MQVIFILKFFNFFHRVMKHDEVITFDYILNF